MNGRRRDQFSGIYPGPYTVGSATKSDVPVTAEGPEGPVVVGRFSRTKATDAGAQAKAYAALNEMIAALILVAHHSPSKVLADSAINALKAAGVDA